jgi:Bifunctional DNA primase/polymerase, N-terminal
VSRRGPQEEAAHKYADHGWFVFPTAPGSKIPATEHGYLDATTDHKAIQHWWRAEPSANVAIATGAPGPDVVDVDKKGDRSGYPAWNALKQAGLAGEPQAIIRTPSGGMHAYYKGTQQRNGHLPDKLIDFRSTGGYVVTAPSTVSGRPYEVVSKQPSAATFSWSAAREHLEPQRQQQPQRQPQRHADRPRDVGHLAAWVAAQQEGNRNEALFWAANRAVEAGDTATLSSLASAARSAGLDQREIDRTIRSAQATTAGRPFEHARTAERERATVHATVRQQAHSGAERAQEPVSGQRVPSPRADIERATAAAAAAARARQHDHDHDWEAGS